mmetsp:Transcript_51909/g.103173  ORF Transcript_51909/g.103173 Transcript_51909/m.103173 type:complete len:105 (-) Transcript_51909:37-351(-)
MDVVGAVADDVKAICDGTAEAVLWRQPHGSSAVTTHVAGGLRRGLVIPEFSVAYQRKPAGKLVMLLLQACEVMAADDETDVGVGTSVLGELIGHANKFLEGGTS